MIRAPKLVVSQPMYAFDPDSWRAEREDSEWGGSRVLRAAWFKRKAGTLVAVMGSPHPPLYDARRAAQAYWALTSR